MGFVGTLVSQKLTLDKINFKEIILIGSPFIARDPFYNKWRIKKFRSFHISALGWCMLIRHRRRRTNQRKVSRGIRNLATSVQ